MHVSTLIIYVQKMREELGTGDPDKDQEIILKFFKVGISFFKLPLIFVVS